MGIQGKGSLKLGKVCNGKQPQVINKEVGNEINLLCSVEDSFITFWKLTK